MLLPATASQSAAAVRALIPHRRSPRLRRTEPLHKSQRRIESASKAVGYQNPVPAQEYPRPRHMTFRRPQHGLLHAQIPEASRTRNEAVLGRAEVSSDASQVDDTAGHGSAHNRHRLTRVDENRARVSRVRLSGSSIAPEYVVAGAASPVTSAAAAARYRRCAPRLWESVSWHGDCSVGPRTLY